MKETTAVLKTFLHVFILIVKLKLILPVSAIEILRSGVFNHIYALLNTCNIVLNYEKKQQHNKRMMRMIFESSAINQWANQNLSKPSMQPQTTLMKKATSTIIQWNP